MENGACACLHREAPHQRHGACFPLANTSVPPCPSLYLILVCVVFSPHFALGPQHNVLAPASRPLFARPPYPREAPSLKQLRRELLHTSARTIDLGGRQCSARQQAPPHLRSRARIQEAKECIRGSIALVTLHCRFFHPQSFHPQISG